MTRVLAVVSSGVLLLACGGDDADEDAVDTDTESTGTTDTTEAPEATDDTEPAEDTEDADGGDAVELDDVCAVLEGVDLAGLLGEETGETESELGACLVRPASAESRGAMQVVVNTTRPADNYETQQELFGVDTEASGFGEAAFHSGPYLVVLTDGALVSLQVVRDSSLGPGVPDAELEAAMTTILANLG